MSSWVNAAGLLLDIAGVIGLGVYSEWGAIPLYGRGHRPRDRRWGALSIASWAALIGGFVLQLIAQFVK
jgi:hypothetical protein